MKFRLGPVPDDPGFRPQEDGWSKVKEPSFGVLMLLAVPLSALVAWLIVVAWGTIAALRAVGGGVGVVVTPSLVLAYLVGFAMVIVVHELCHAIALPRAGTGPATTLGFWPQTLTPYVSYEGELPRSRHIVIGVAPFVILSIAPLVLGLALGAVPVWAVALSVLNGFGASGDLIGVALLAWQVPTSAVVRNKGLETWWRLS